MFIYKHLANIQIFCIFAAWKFLLIYHENYRITKETTWSRMHINKTWGES